MYKKKTINTIANGTKLLIDSLPLSKYDKNYAKDIVDLAAETMKLSIALQETKIRLIQKTAFSCGLDRIVAFPYMMNGTLQYLIKMYGGDIAKFCGLSNIAMISDQNVLGSACAIDDAERKYGVVLYERN